MYEERNFDIKELIDDIEHARDMMNCNAEGIVNSATTYLRNINSFNNHKFPTAETFRETMERDLKWFYASKNDFITKVNKLRQMQREVKETFEHHGMNWFNSLSENDRKIVLERTHDGTVYSAWVNHLQPQNID